MVGAMFTSIDIPATEQQFQGADPAVGISLPPGLRHSEKRLRKRRDLDAVGAAAAVLPQINSTPGMKHYHTNICLKWWPLVTLARVLFLPVSTVQLGKHRNQGALGLNVIVSMVFFLYFFCAQSLARPLPASPATHPYPGSGNPDKSKRMMMMMMMRMTMMMLVMMMLILI